MGLAINNISVEGSTIYYNSSCWGSWKLESFCEEVGEELCN